VRLQRPLALHTSIRVGGPAAYFVEPADVEALARALDFAYARGLPWYVLGNGTNTLFPDEGFPGVVIHLGPGGGLSDLSWREGTLHAGAGASLAAARHTCSQNGCGALDSLVGVPASVGGALAMNAGVPEGTVGALVLSVTALDPLGNIVELDQQACGFGYRASRLRSEGFVVLSARLRCDTAARCDLSALAQRRRSQPLGNSFGCTFKNPADGAQSAGWMIERCGLKGFRVGDAQVSRAHANFILNRGKANCADILTLIDIVRERVYKEFSLELRLEVEVVTK